MSRVYETWSPDRSDVVVAGSRDANLVLNAFQQAINGGSTDAQELYERRLSPQVNVDGTAYDGLSFSTSEAPLVVDTLASFGRELPKSKLLTRRRVASLIGLTAVIARDELSV